MTPLSREELRELAPGYAMGTLTPAERADFERAMADPEVATDLRLELDAHRATMEALASAHAVRPPADLRARTLARIAKEPRRADSTSEERPATTPVLPFERPKRGLNPWVTGGLVTALAASALFSINLKREVDRLRNSASERDSALAVAEARLKARDETVRILTSGGNDLVMVRLTANEAAGPSMRVFWNVKDGSAVIDASGLRQIPATRSYALWMIRDGKPVPLALFKPDSTGHSLVNGVNVPKELAGVAAFAVTEEPAEGSPQPTMTPFLVGAVKQ